MINHRCSEALLGAPCVAWGALRAVLGCVALWAVVHNELGSLLAMVHATHLDVPLPHQVGFAAQEPRGGPGKGHSVQSWSHLKWEELGTQQGGHQLLSFTQWPRVYSACSCLCQVQQSWAQRLPPHF